MLRTIRKHTVNAKAQGLTEYIIIVALIAVASVAVVMVFGKQVRHAFLTITHSLAGTGTGEQVDQADTAGGIGQDRDIGLDDFDMSPKGGSGGTRRMNYPPAYGVRALLPRSILRERARRRSRLQESQQMQPLSSIILFLLLITAAYTDLRCQQVPNWLTLPCLATGIVLSLTTRGLRGIEESIFGIIIAAAIFLPFFLARSLGGGDVKLMVAVGSLGGYPYILWAIFYGVLLGGGMGAFHLLRKACFWFTLRRVFLRWPSFLFSFRGTLPLTTAEKEPIPYAFALALGSVFAWFL